MEKYKFSELQYEPTDYSKVNEKYLELEKKALSAESLESLEDVLLSYDRIVADAEYNFTLAYIHSSLDAKDEKWQKAIVEETQGSAMSDSSGLVKAILGNTFFPLLEKKYGKALSIKLNKRLQTEGKAQAQRAKEGELVSSYQRIKAMVRATYNGTLMSEGGFYPLFSDPDRKVRIQSRKAIFNAFLEKKEELGKLLETLVALRDSIAKENGFENYLEYMDFCYCRFGYGEKELDRFVEEVKKYVVPLYVDILEETRKRLSLDRMMVYDMGLMFTDGNPKPMGDSTYLTEASRRVYNNLSPEIGEFFSGMVETESLNVDFSPNKVAGMGFCTELRKGMYPYVFGSLDGTAEDVAVFTHEVGHAWQSWKSDQRLKLSLFREVPLDAVEIPSKTMELFTYEGAEEFFGKDGEKFRFSHFRNAIREIINYSAIHELNTWIYTHVGATFDEINAKWLQIHSSFFPGLEWGELEEEEKKGASLLRNMGVYMFPRYLISYALSEMCAMDLFFLKRRDREGALAAYSELCSQGGDKSYVEILAQAGLEPSYKEGRVKKVMEEARAYLVTN